MWCGSTVRCFLRCQIIRVLSVFIRLCVLLGNKTTQEDWWYYYSVGSMIYSTRWAKLDDFEWKLSFLLELFYRIEIIWRKSLMAESVCPYLLSFGKYKFFKIVYCQMPYLSFLKIDFFGTFWVVFSRLNRIFFIGCRFWVFNFFF